MKKPTKIYRLWGGFCDDRLDLQELDRGWGGWGVERDRAPAIYTSRVKARAQYQDVRRIEIREIPEKR